MNAYHLTKIKQHFPHNSIADITAEVARELVKLRPFIKPDAQIAIAIGSRGIKNLVPVLKEVSKFIMEHNARPFIVPAMGSHGGASAEGQAGILASYGISEKTIGIPVRSSMEVVELAQGDSPVPVYMDKNAYQSDGVILINRIKPHTDFHSRYESGLVKMSVIGLGKEKQASAIHGYGVFGLTTLIPSAAKQVFNTGKILGGIAMVENAYDDTMILKALKTDDFFEQEPILLDIARKNMPALPVSDIDVLIIDRMGKDISGVGMDPNIIGRTKIFGQEEPDHPSIKAIVVLDLSDDSIGNAIGVGLSDVITKTLYDKIDFSSTYSNAITSSFLERAKIPIVAGTHKEAFEIALRSCGFLKKGEEKIIRIKDTLHLGEIYVSKSILDIIDGSENIESLKENVPLFNRDNEITPY
jgi:hypothetical protein